MLSPIHVATKSTSTDTEASLLIPTVVSTTSSEDNDPAVENAFARTKRIKIAAALLAAGTIGAGIGIGAYELYRNPSRENIGIAATAGVFIVMSALSIVACLKMNIFNAVDHRRTGSCAKFTAPRVNPLKDATDGPKAITSKRSSQQDERDEHRSPSPIA